MKVKYNSPNGKFAIDIEGEEMVDIFEKIGHVQDVFDETKCIKCGNENLKFTIRRNKDDDPFYELRCGDIKTCGAKLQYGPHKKGGTLFPKRKDADGNFLPDDGWIKWDASKKCNV